MRSKVTFIEIIRRITSSNVSQILDSLDSTLASNPILDGQKMSILRHLETLGFRFDSTGQFKYAARVYELAASVCNRNRDRWDHLAIKARLEDLTVRVGCDDTLSVITSIKQNFFSDKSHQYWIERFLRRAWDHECNYEIKLSVQCYRIAYELGGGHSRIITRDGNTISNKIRNLQILQMNALAEAGLHEEAAVLHERTRVITGLSAAGIYNIVSAQQAALKGNGEYFEVLPSRKLKEPNVKFFGGPVTLTSEAGSLEAPTQYVAFFKNCVTFPRSNLVVQGKNLIYDLAAHPRSSVAEIRDGVNPDQIMQAVYGAGRALVEIPEKLCEVDAGLMLFGFQSRNYGHWLLEFVPRMLWFNNPICPPDFPICIDENMPASHRQITEILNEGNRHIVTLQAIPTRFGEIGIAPVPAFFPFDIRAGQQVYDTIWPGDILRKLSKKVLDVVKANTQQSGYSSLRLFISRKSYSQRQLVNELEIEETLSCQGFITFQPEEISFAEQIILFNSAELIVGSASSALTNCIFCRPGANVIALIHENTSFNFRGYTSMIESSGATLTFIRGKNIKDDVSHPFHANFTIDLKELQRAIAAASIK